MKIFELKVPVLGEGIESAIVACWHFKEGDKVALEDDVVELVTAKASFSVPAGSAGILKKILIKEKQEAKISDVLAVIEVSG